LIPRTLQAAAAIGYYIAAAAALAGFLLGLGGFVFMAHLLANG
jgi:hypothetical protein